MSTTVYACETCGLRLSSKGCLKRHCKRHDVDKPYKCPNPGCDYVTIQLVNLQRHIRSHSGQKPYRCEYPQCNGVFSDASALTKHMKIKHGYKPRPRRVTQQGVIATPAVEPVNPVGGAFILPVQNALHLDLGLGLEENSYNFAGEVDPRIEPAVFIQGQENIPVQTVGLPQPQPEIGPLDFSGPVMQNYDQNQLNPFLYDAVDPTQMQVQPTVQMQMNPSFDPMAVDPTFAPIPQVPHANGYVAPNNTYNQELLNSYGQVNQENPYVQNYGSMPSSRLPANDPYLFPKELEWSDMFPENFQTTPPSANFPVHGNVFPVDNTLDNQNNYVNYYPPAAAGQNNF